VVVRIYGQSGSPPPKESGRLAGFADPRQYMSDKYDFCVCLQLGMNVVFKKSMFKAALRLFEGKDYHTTH